MELKVVLAVLIIAGFLTGIRLMQSPRTALWGNRLGAFSMLFAITWTFVTTGGGTLLSAILFVSLGAIAGLILGQSVKMIQMPQTVALLNGFGGAASALVVLAAIPGSTVEGVEVLFWSTSGLALVIGALTFSGSIIAMIKLQGLAFRQPVQIPGHGIILRLAFLSALLVIILNLAYGGTYAAPAMALIAVLGLLAGLLISLRIGGADMPIVISLLNSFSGIAASIAGLAVTNLILAGTGALVGVAGLILTRLMCRAMNRSLANVLTGFVPGSHKKRNGEPGVTAGEPFGESVGPDHEETGGPAGKTNEEQTGEKPGPDDLPGLLNTAQRVIIVPGYGMAVAQAQMAVGLLATTLEQKGKDVKFAIHPVAGRMPGHMNVLLAEAGVDYEKLLDIEEINPQFEHADLVIVVGACDVVNPAANAADGTPISGMPILEAEKAKAVIVCNLDEKPGYSGVDNLLYEKEHVLTIWGDASEVVPKLIDMIN